MWTVDGKTGEWKMYTEGNRKEADLVEVQKNFCVLFHIRCNKTLVTSFEQKEQLLKFRDVKLLTDGGMHTNY